MIEQLTENMLMLGAELREGPPRGRLIYTPIELGGTAAEMLQDVIEYIDLAIDGLEAAYHQ